MSDESKSHELFERIAWLDVARGACVILVVFHHVVRQQVLEFSGSWRLAGEWWSVIDEILEPIRIPLFFAISGALASSRIMRVGASLRPRIVVPVYLYLLWSCLLASRELVPHSGSGDFGVIVKTAIAEVVFVCSGYWYLFSLPLYAIIARVSRTWPVWILLLAGVGLYASRSTVSSHVNQLSGQWTDSPSLLGSVAANFIFFLVGVRFRVQLLRVVAAISLKTFLAGILLYAGFVALYMVTGVWTFALVASAVGIVTGASFARAVSNRPASARLGAVGAQTLPVYVLQFFFVSLLALLLGVATPAISSLPVVLAFVYPLGVTFLIAVFSLALHSAALRFGLGFLFSPPQRVLGS